MIVHIFVFLSQLLKKIVFRVHSSPFIRKQYYEPQTVMLNENEYSTIVLFCRVAKKTCMPLGY